MPNILVVVELWLAQIPPFGLLYLGLAHVNQQQHN